MKTLALGLLMTAPLFSTQILNCTAPGYSFSGAGGTCTFPANPLDPNTAAQPLSVTAVDVTLITGNTLTFTSGAFVSTLPEYTTGPFSEIVSVTWNDRYILPDGNANDTYSITSSIQQQASTGDVELVVGSFQQFSSDGTCLLSGPCPQTRVTIAGSSGFMPIFSGGDWNCDFENPALPQSEPTEIGIFANLQVSRFHADGTPDDFAIAPEPSTAGMVLIAIALGIQMVRKRCPGQGSPTTGC